LTVSIKDGYAPTASVELLETISAQVTNPVGLQMLSLNQFFRFKHPKRYQAVLPGLIALKKEELF
jgi:hypothetical protein